MNVSIPGLGIEQHLEKFCSWKYIIAFIDIR